MDGNVLVSVILGSGSDLGIVRQSGLARVYQSCGISYEPVIASGDRHRFDLEKYCQGAMLRGVRYFNTIAGKTPILTRAVESIVSYSAIVIGVALDEAGLRTIWDKPEGVAPLTMGVGKADLFNMGLATARMIAINDLKVMERLAAFHAHLATIKPPQFKNVSIEQEVTES